mgnify:CR=1 FL=1
MQNSLHFFCMIFFSKDGDGFENLLQTKFKAIAARLMNNNNNKKKRCNQNYPVLSYTTHRYDDDDWNLRIWIFFFLFESFNHYLCTILLLFSSFSYLNIYLKTKSTSDCIFDFWLKSIWSSHKHIYLVFFIRSCLF